MFSAWGLCRCENDSILIKSAPGVWCVGTESCDYRYIIFTFDTELGNRLLSLPNVFSFSYRVLSRKVACSRSRCLGTVLMINSSGIYGGPLHAVSCFEVNVSASAKHPLAISSCTTVSMIHHEKHQF